jgi:hypothetical protein
LQRLDYVEKSRQSWDLVKVYLHLKS